jgi:protease I
MANELRGKRIAFLATDGVEQDELTEPWKAVRAAGGETQLISIKSGRIQAVSGMDKSDTFPVDKLVDEVTAQDFDGLVLPGGVANPDRLRQNKRAVELVRSFFESGKPVAAICHGPWMLVEAGVVRGRTLTSWSSLQTDIRNAGGTWVDEQVRTDRGLVTSRKPDDIPVFNKKIVEEFAEGPHAAQAAALHEAASATGVQ